MVDTNARDPNEIAVSICGFVADLLSHTEDFPLFVSFIQNDENSTSLEQSLSALPLNPSILSARSRNLLDSSATALWNAFNRLLQITDEVEFTHLFIQGRLKFTSTHPKADFSKVPLLAYHMLVSCVAQEEDAFSRNSRYLMVLIRCVEICLAGDMTEKASSILQQAASAVDVSQVSGPVDKEIEIFIAKYHILHATLALKDGNIKLIEAKLSQVSDTSMETDPSIGKQYVILCHAALRQTLGRAEAADKWLLRISGAFGIFHKYSSLYSDCREVNLEVIYTLATADMSVVSEAFEPLAMRLFQTVELDHPNDSLVWVLHLEFMSNQKRPDLRMFHEALMSFLNLMEHSIVNFRRFLKYISKLRNLGSDLALETLGHLLQRINSFPQDERWLENTFFALTRLLTSASWRSLGCLKTLENMANILSEILPQYLSNEASDASLIIIWKEAEYFLLQENFLEALDLYRFSQHALFHRASEANKIKILRKLILCGFQLDDPSQVKRAWMALPEQERDPQTTYLAYRVLLKDPDPGLAAGLQESLTKLGQEGHIYTSAAIAGASLSQERRQALETIQYILEKTPEGNENTQPNFSLYRIAVQLIVLEIRENDEFFLHEQLCRLLSRVVDLFQCWQNFEINDLDWFSRCSYLASLELFHKIDGYQVLSLLDISLKLINMYPQSIGSDVKLDLLRRRISSHHVHVLINTAIARQETDSTKKKLSYSKVENHFQKIQTVIPDSRRSGRDQILSEEQYRQMLLFKTEAIVYLQQWSQDDAINEK